MDNQDLFSVRGKHVLLTGGTRGLGYGLAEGFARAGARLVITGTSERVFDAAEALAGETGGDVRGTVARLDEAEHVDAFYRQAWSSWTDGWMCWSTAPGFSTAAPPSASPWRSGTRFSRSI